MREKINLQELTTLLSEKAGISKKEADAFLREFFGLMTDTFIEDKQVKIRNLGTFKLTEVEDRESVNVRTGARVLIPAHTKITYIQDKTLSEIINKPYEGLQAKIIEETKPETNEINEEINLEIVEIEESKPETEPEKTAENFFFPDNTPLEIDDELSDDVIKARKRHVKIVFFTFLTITALIAVFYFFSRENAEILTGYHPSQPAKTPVDLTSEKDTTTKDNDPIFGETGETINPADTVIPIKQTWVPGKKRKTKVGERLTLISFEEYGDVVFWIYIYEENKHLISKDNYVKAGVNIVIPPPEKYDIDAKNPKSLQKAREFAQNYNKTSEKN